MEIPVGLPSEPAAGDEDEGGSIILAPLGRRFLAGLLDALILIIGGGVFGALFWTILVSLTPLRRLSPAPLNLAVLGLLLVIYIFAYFGLLCAVASATPGMLLMGCEILNLQGEHPTIRESLWRAFGVLVSLSALMLGFIWAFVDSDSLTWHDRMSGTVIADEQSTADLATLKVESKPYAS